MISIRKYSILIPTRNSVEYLSSCIWSVLSQKCLNFELIISDNHSTDSTWEYLQSLNDIRVRVVQPETCLSMTDHWEWLLSHATGEWVSIIGTDDGLQPYFFELADHLTVVAEKKGIRAINSTRAYFFWKGCEARYSNEMVAFSAKPVVTIKHTVVQTLITLLKSKDYFDLPQMYTTALFRRDLIEQAKGLQNGRFYTSLTPDANGATVVCSLDKRYLDCKIPLGWVGSSPKSNGYSSSGKVSNAESIKAIDVAVCTDFKALNLCSNIKWDERAGSQDIFSVTLIFWEAMLQTYRLQSDSMRRMISSQLMKTFMFGAVLYEIQSAKNRTSVRLDYLHEAIKLNQCSLRMVILAAGLSSLTRKIAQYIDIMTTRTVSKAKKRARLFLSWDDHADFDLGMASNMVDALNKKEKFVERLVLSKS